MQTIRYINLLDRTSQVKTRNCFIYNNTIIFAVQKELVSRAIGPNGTNIRRINEQLGKRIKVIVEPKDISDAERFILDIVSPIKFKSLELKDDCFILNAGAQSKAALIGRNRRRYDELKSILEASFGKDLRIV